jgi:hypothetical protein
MDIFEASLCGEQDSPAIFPFPCAQHRPPTLAGEAGPPPSGAGRRGCLSFPPDPLGMFARFPSMRSTHLRSFWPPGREPLLGLAQAKRRRAPLSPLCPGVPTAAPRTHESWTVGSMIHGVRQVKGGTPSVWSTVDPCTGFTARLTAASLRMRTSSAAGYEIHGSTSPHPGQNSSVPVRAGILVKETLGLCLFTSWSSHLYKSLQIGHESYVLAPAFSV